MASESGGPLLAFIRRLAGSRTHSDLTDGELLQRFAVRREESAFTTLMQRHGPMVLGVCRGILRDAHDAEDAFQATFLVLVRKPWGIGKPASVASWLHGVAYRLATRARSQAARRRSHERQAVTVPKGEPHEEVIWRDLRPVLHQEVDRLPEKYRLPFVLCHLEGKTNEEAGRLLGLPRGTVLSRLSRARERLRQRLTRRGLALTSGLLAAALSQSPAQAAVPVALAESTLQAALSFTAGAATAECIAAPVRAYAEGMLRAALVARLKLTAVLLLAVAAAGVGAGALAHRIRTSAREDVVSGEPPGRSAGNLPPAPRPPVPNRDRLEGAWRVVSAEQFGRGTDVLRERRLVFAGDRFSLSGGRGEVPGVIRSVAVAGNFTLEAADPNRIDFIEGNWHLHGVYLPDGEKLLLCLSNARQDGRPADFTTNPNSRRLRLTLERE
jgi:RNA polymerase sigma factor (sigma-70 family)